MMDDQRQKVLIIDDEPLNLKHLAELLSGEHKVILAKSGAQGLERVRTAMPDMVLLDVMMPDMDGYEVCRRLKADQDTKDIPVVYITALDSLESEEKGLLLGATDYITKPFKPGVVKVRVRNILTLVRQRTLLEQLANLDGLTEIPNRRSYEATLDREWRRCLRSTTPLSAAMLDIDFFKQFNDRYGHSAGDLALKAVAGVLRGVIKRPGDMAARYGGEEFVILMPETGAQGALETLERIRAAVESLCIPHADSAACRVLTISTGGSTTLPTEISSPAELICKADAMLYQAKKQGRNQVVWTPWPEGETPS